VWSVECGAEEAETGGSSPEGPYYTCNLLYRNAFNRKTCYYGQTLAVLSLPTYILLAIPDTSIYRTGLAETGGYPHTI